MRQSRAVVAWLGAGALALAVLAAGCKYDPAGFADDGIAGADAGGDGVPDGAIADDGGLLCNPGTDVVCLDSNTLQKCGPAGAEKEMCAQGCGGGAGEAHCKKLTPSNGVDLAWLEGVTADLEVPMGQRWVMDTDTGRIFDCAAGNDLRPSGTGLSGGIRFEVVPARPGAPAIGVWSFAKLRVKAEIFAIGSNAVAILASGEVRIEKRVFVGGGARVCSITAACFGGGVTPCAGPGGGEGGNPGEAGTGPGGGLAGSGGDGAGVPELGGGGGGYSDVGGPGGSAGGAGGGAYGLSLLDPILGGAGGGGGGSGSSPGGLGGGGGGALQITSLTEIEINGGGQAYAGGAGGAPGVGGDGSGGGGGGSGGAILLEAPILKIDGLVATNGGGGGGANASGGSFGETAGSDGNFSAMPAAGGLGFYAGGAGGAGMLPAGVAGNPATPGVDGGAGGGGAAGRICLRTVIGGLTRAGGSIVSPPPTVTLDLIR